MQSSGSPQHSLWVILLFPILWIAISGVLAALSGWSSLATRFRTAGPSDGKTFSWVSGSIGARLFPVSYGYCLRVTAGAVGVRLSLLPLFGAFSPPLFIPWREVESVETTRVFFWSYAAIRVREHWANIRIHGEAGEHIRQSFARYRVNALGQGSALGPNNSSKPMPLRGA